MTKLKSFKWKKLIKPAAVALFLCMAAGLLAGCAAKPFDFYKEDLAKYVTLGKYIGVEVEVEDDRVTDEDMEMAVLNIRSDYQVYFTEEERITDRAVQLDDIANIDFAGFLGDEQFDGGTLDGHSLWIGGKGFIEGFEEGLIGVMPGIEVDINVTFPDPYLDGYGNKNEKLSGQAVVFKVTVNYIEGYTPVFDDEFVKENKDSLGTEFETAAAYLADYKEKLQTQKTDYIKGGKVQDVWKIVVDNASIVIGSDGKEQYPKNLVKKHYDDFINYYAGGAQEYGMSLGDFVEYAYGMTEDEFKEYALKEYAMPTAKEELVFYSIVRAEGYDIDDTEYFLGAVKYAQSSYTTVEELEEYYGKEAILTSLLWDKVLEALADKAIEKIK